MNVQSLYRLSHSHTLKSIISIIINAILVCYYVIDTCNITEINIIKD